MYRGTFKAVLAGVALGVSLGNGAALAHGGPGWQPATGIITGLSNNSMQVHTTGSANITANLTAHTRVVRALSGSTADLKVNQEVDAHLVRGTTVVDAIRIEAPSQRGSHAPHSQDPRHQHARPSTGPRGSGTHPAGQHHPGALDDEVSGQVTGVSGNTVTIKDHRGNVKTYRLSTTVTVTKIVSGTTSDLALGQKVQVARDRNGNAVFITIVNS